MKTTFSKIILFTNEIENSLGGMEIHRNEFLKRCNICITKENNISIYRNKILIKSYANNKLINMTFIEMASKCITPLHSMDLFNLNGS